MKLILIYTLVNGFATTTDSALEVKKHDFDTPAACYAAAAVLKDHLLQPSTFNNIIIRDVSCI